MFTGWVSSFFVLIPSSEGSPAQNQRRIKSWHFPFVQTRICLQISFSTSGDGETVSGLAPYFPWGAGKSCLYCKTRKTNGKKKWRRGKKGGWKKTKNVHDSHHAGVLKITLVKSINPDPNVYPSSPQHSPPSVVRPDLSLRARPSPRDREEGKAGLATLLASRLPPPARSPARRRLTAPAS